MKNHNFFYTLAGMFFLVCIIHVIAAIFTFVWWTFVVAAITFGLFVFFFKKGMDCYEKWYNLNMSYVPPEE